MPEWFSNAVASSAAVAWDVVLIRLILALLLGSLITVIYNGMRNSSGSSEGTFSTTLVLLCVLIAMVTQVIGNDIARAFSLVGALSIVRFRTVVRDTRDTAFVIFSVIVGMAVGAGQTNVALCGMAVIAVAAVLMRDRVRNVMTIERDTILTVKFTWTAALEKLVTDSIARFASEIEPISVVTVRQGAAFELEFRLQLLPNVKPTEMVAELNRIEGVMSVELHAQRSNGS